MTPRTRRLVAVAVVSLGVFTPIDLLLWNSLRGEQVQASAEAWFRLHAQSLPQSMVDLKALPFTYRRRVLAVLPPATRALLWQEHLLAYQSAHRDLTQEQNSTLSDAIEFCVPDHFAGNLAPDAVARLTNIEARATEQFVPEVLVPLFYRFGSEPVTDGEVVLGRESLLVRWLRATVLVQAVDVSCDCAASHDWCGLTQSGSTCVRGLGSCTVIPNACGFLLIWDCDGGCQTIIQ
jgi:hypothetical protein